MTKVDLIAQVAEKTGLTKKDTEKVVTAVLDTITENLVKGEKVSLVGFGSFEVKVRAAREGINPRTKEKIEIPSSKLPVFVWILFLLQLSELLFIFSHDLIRCQSQCNGGFFLNLCLRFLLIIVHFAHDKLLIFP